MEKQKTATESGQFRTGPCMQCLKPVVMRVEDVAIDEDLMCPTCSFATWAARMEQVKVNVAA